MTRREMEERFRKIAGKDTTMDKREQEALLDQFVELHDRADLGYVDDMLINQASRVYGVMDFLMALGKIRDDEDLHMLVNEIEAFAYEVAEDPEKSSWGPKELAEV